MYRQYIHTTIRSLDWSTGAPLCNQTTSNKYNVVLVSTGVIVQVRLMASSVTLPLITGGSTTTVNLGAIEKEINFLTHCSWNNK